MAEVRVRFGFRNASDGQIVTIASAVVAGMNRKQCIPGPARTDHWHSGGNRGFAERDRVGIERQPYRHGTQKEQARSLTAPTT